VTGAPPPTVNLAASVYGPNLDPADPAELLHEASKLQPSLVIRQMRGVWTLEQSPALQASSSRSVRRNPGVPRLKLPAGGLPPVTLADTLRRRRSARRFADRALSLDELAAVLRAGYGVTRARAKAEAPALRTAPSAGALYPLELYVAAQRVDRLEAGLYHYDPLAHELGELGDARELAPLSPHSDVVESAAAMLFVAAIFWRSRFKYGLRAYRFTVLEAGHVSQNVLLAATALDLGGIVLGGFYDARVDALLGLDGVNESTLVAICVGALER
jgi:SagB-type dehydrogenase family enzyme